MDDQKANGKRASMLQSLEFRVAVKRFISRECSFATTEKSLGELQATEHFGLLVCETPQRFACFPTMTGRMYW